jgi:eukaryotic-like serine/threonine-protein kinase
VHSDEGDPAPSGGQYHSVGFPDTSQAPLPGSPVTEVVPPLAHALRDRYVLEKELGRGGMATVYCARDLRHDRLVALKVLHPELAATLGPARFLREIQVTSGLQHPHILPVFDSGDAAGQLWYTMPYVRGESLRDRLRREVQLRMDTALDLTKQVADALGYAHCQGIVHRDIKPENILLEGDRAVVADFGIARALDLAGGERLTETGLALGTPTYMSPEQAMGSPVDARSDVYSLGCVLYEMLAGEPPFTGPTAQAIIAKRLSSPVPPLRTVRETVSPAVERAIEVALAKVPADRFATTEEFVAALYGAGPSDVRPLAAARSIPRRRVAMAAGIAVVGVAAVLALNRWSTPAVLPDTSLVAVVPFRIASSDSSLAYLHEGLVDLFAAKLNGEAGPKSVDPRAVMRLWNASAEGRSDLPEGEVLRLARRLGAGRVLTGSIVGTAERLVLSAAVVDVSTGNPRQQATVDGSHDSLPYLVDRLAGQLLALGAGFQSQQLASLTSASLPALRAYLSGASAARAGRWSAAIKDFNGALKLDSAFALAGLGVAAASAWLDGSESERGQALAWAAKDRLSWRDRTLLEAIRRNTLKAMQELVQKIPDSPVAWYGLGDKYYHDGALRGVTDADQRALAAFKRALALDTASATSPNAEPLAHFADLSLAAGDSATVRHLLSAAMAQDTTGEFTAMHRMELARASGDTAAIARWRATLGRANFPTLLTTIWRHQASGEEVWEAQRAVEIAMRQGETDPELKEGRPFIRLLAHDLALNRGRPQEALAARAPQFYEPVQVRWVNRASIDDALFWGGDTTVADKAAEKIAIGVARPPPSDADSLLHWYYYEVCTLEQWRLAHGDLRSAPASVARLRAAARIPTIQFREEHERCAELLDAWYATSAHRADALQRLRRVDSLQVSNPVGITSSPIEASNLLVTRLWQEQGNWPRAEAAARRRYKGLNPRFLSTYLREEGRAAAAVGHREAAIRAYHHYLALRYDPEPSVKPEVEQVRADLADLLGERGK